MFHPVRGLISKCMGLTLGNKAEWLKADFVAYDKLTTGLRHDLGPFSEL